MRKSQNDFKEYFLVGSEFTFTCACLMPQELVLLHFSCSVSFASLSF